MQYTTHIKAKTGWFDIDLKELFRYRDLIFLFVKRTYTTMYKQTILGPMWLILNPLITVMLYAFVFGRVAGLSTDGAPQFAFYLCSNAIWSFFATCITETSATFTANAAIMGKVYFPRLVMPISSVVTAMLNMLIQLGILVPVIIYYLIKGSAIYISASILLVPVLILQTGILGLGCGIIVASLTTKYRDLVILVSFGVQLWMYATPVIYPLSVMKETYPKHIWVLAANPLTAILETFKYAFTGVGEFNWFYLGYSFTFTIIILLLGIIIFNRVQRNFMDVI